MEWSSKLIQFVIVPCLFGTFLAAVDPKVTVSNFITHHLESASPAHVPRSVDPSVFASSSVSPLPFDQFSNREANVGDDDDNQLIIAETKLKCDHVSNGIVQQFEDTLYLLSGDQLFRVDVLEDKKELFPLATFDQFSGNATAFTLHPWTDDQLVVVVAFQTHYIVYVFHVPDHDDDGASFNQKQHVQQKIAINSPAVRSIKVHLFTVQKELYLLLAQTNDQNSNSGISILSFRKHPSYFMKYKSISTTTAIDLIDVEKFDQELLIMVVHYCRKNSNCHKHTIVLYGMELDVMQNLYTEAKFVKLIKYHSEPRVVACIPKECLVYFWDEKHFSNPSSLPMNFNVAELETKRNRVFMRSQENVLHLFSRKEMKYAESLELTDIFGKVEINAIQTDFDKVFLIVTSIDPTMIQFNFFDIKNDTNVILGSEKLPNIQDPFDKIDGCATQLNNRLRQSFLSLTRINTILPEIVTTTKKKHFKKLTVKNSVTIKSTVNVKEISLRKSMPINASVTLSHLNRMDNQIKEMNGSANNLVLIDDEMRKPRDNSDQESSSLLIAKSIRVKHLRTDSHQFRNMITRRGRNVLNGTLSVGTLIIPNLQVSSDSVNNVPLKSLFINGRTTAPIQGQKILKELSTDQLTINKTLNTIPIQHLNDFRQKFSNNKQIRLRKVRAQKLTVDHINGINVDKFFADCYRVGRSPSIKGNLLISKPLRIANLHTKLLNRIPVTEYFNLKHEQVINRKVIFKNFFVHQLNAKRINGIEFGKTVAIQGEENLIETPVRIHQMKIGRRLILSDNEKREMAHHIVGTRVEDLTQSYTGKVVIKGNLILHNATLENPVNFFLDDQRFPLDSLSDFWKRNSHQEFNKKVILKGRVSTSQLLAEKINGHPVSSFVTTDQEMLQTNGSIHFLDTVIERNIRTNGVSKILEISRNAVRKGEMNIIEGTKHFENITVNNLISSFINDQTISHHFLHLNTILACDRKITFDALYLETDLEHSGKHLHVDSIDQVNLHSLFIDTVYINRPAELVSIEIDQFEADGELNVENLNGVNTSGALERINNLQFVVNVTGRAKVNRLTVDHLNDVNVNDYFNLIVRRDHHLWRGHHELGGRKKFLKGFTVLGDLRVQNLSGIDMNHWMRNVLRWDENHNITEEWVFKAISAESLYATRINQMPANLLIDSKSTLILDQDLSVNKLTVDGGKLEAIGVGAHNWTRIIHNLHNPLPRKWQRIEVTGDVSMPHLNSKLGELITHGVNNRHAQVFTGHVNFVGRTKIKNLYTNNRTVCGVDLAYVLQDTLRDDISEVQIVTGAVVFEQGFDARRLRVNHLDVVHINDINMVHLNQSLWRPGGYDPILPRLHFANFTVDKLRVNGSINRVYVDELGMINDTNLMHLEIRHNFTVTGNLIVDNINYMPMSYFLKERGRLRSKPGLQRFNGALTFENLVIRGASTLQGINGVSINSLLLSRSRRNQRVTGLKSFNSVYFQGPSSVEQINNVPFTNKYKSVVDKRRNHQLQQFNAREIIAQRGLEIRESLNDIPIEYFRAEQPNLPDVKQVEHQLTTILNEDLQRQRGKRKFLYFDYAHNFEVAPQGNDSSYIVLNRYTRSDCKSGGSKCLCKRQVEIQMSKFNEIQVHPTNDILFEEPIGSVDVQLLVNNSCDPENAFSTLRVTRNGQSMKTQIKGSATIIGTMSTNDSKVVFLTGAQFKDNFTISTWQVHSSQGQTNLKKLHAHVFAKSKRSHAHLMRYKSNHLLVVCTDFPKTDQKLSWVYKFAPEEEHFKVQHILRTYYDMLSSVSTDQESYLAGGRTGAKSMDIYKVYQTIDGVHQLSSRTRFPLKTPLKDLLAFTGQDQLFVAALLENGHLLIFRYHFIRGWLEESFGNFRNIPSVEKLSLISDPVTEMDYLVVTGANSTASLISIN